MDNKEIIQRPNILCFVTDQQRYDYLGCTGNAVISTPNIDKIASRGVIFDRAYVINPLCMPARSTLFTGLTPRGHRVRTNGIPLEAGIPTLPDALRKAGYQTYAAGKLHLECHAEPRRPGSRLEWGNNGRKKLPQPYYGFENVDFVGGHGSSVFGEYVNWLEEKEKGMSKAYLPENALERKQDKRCYCLGIPEEYHYNRWISDRTIDFLETARDKENPFFIWCSFPDPHHPYCAPEPWCSMYNPDDIEVEKVDESEFDNLPPFYRKLYEEKGIRISGIISPTKTPEGALKEIIAMTYGMISFIDHEIGRVLKKLEDSGLDKNTVIVFLADHGDMMGDHGMIRKGPFHFGGLLKIPFIWSWPGHFKETLHIGGLASQIDFVPTILDICGLSGIYDYSGDGFMNTRLDRELPGKSLVPLLTGEKCEVNKDVIVEQDEDYLGLRLRTLITGDYRLTIYPGQEYGELFDLKNDPKEKRNLWDNKEYAQLKYELKSRLLERYILTEPVIPYKYSHA